MPVITMPKLSDTMTEGILVRWLKNDGDPVEISEVIAEIETDKATMEMEAFDEGTLKIYAREGDKVPVGGAIAFVSGEGEEAPDSPPEAASAATTPASAPPSAPPASPSPPAEGPPPLPAPEPVPSGEPVAASGRIKASPVASKIAAEKGIDLATITGSGPGGRIVKRDVLGSDGPAAAPSPPAQPAPASPAPPPSAAANDRRVPLTGMRSIIAERLLASKTRIPHFYLHIEVDAAPLMGLRRQINAAAEGSETANKYTVNDFVLKAAVAAAVAVPAANASFDGDAIVYHAAINLSVAVALEEGLVTPVIRDAEELSLLELSLAVKEIAHKARNKRLSPDAFSGGTITVSNLGAYGIDAFDAIINPPQAVILSIGSIVTKPVVDSQGEIVPGQRMNVGLSCDHRVVDGAVGARYLAEFKKLLENPALMLV